MLELLNSLVRLSAAVTVYSMQEAQTAASSVSPTESVDKLRDMIDSLTNSVSSKIEASRRSTLDSFANLGQNVVDQTVGRTMDTLNSTLHVPSMLPKDILQSTTDAVKSTSDWLGKIVKPAGASGEKAAPVEKEIFVEEIVIVS